MQLINISRVALLRATRDLNVGLVVAVSSALPPSQLGAPTASLRMRWPTGVTKWLVGNSLNTVLGCGCDEVYGARQFAEGFEKQIEGSGL